MRRTHLTWALLLSLALHLGLGLLLHGAEPPSPTSVRPAPAELAWVEVERPPPPPPPVAAPPRPAPGAASRPPRAAPPRTATAAPPPPATSPSTPASEAPVPDAPQALKLLPGLSLSPGAVSGGLPVPRGRTLRPGEGPSAEALLGAEKERVQGRVQGFLDDGMARLQVENGLADTFFGDMDKALEKGLSGAPLFEYRGVLQHFFKARPENVQGLRDFLASVHSYGASGSPDSMGSPSGTDRLEDVARSGGAGARARSQRSTTDVLEEYNRRVGALHVKMELEQAPSGQVLGVKLLESSGNALFDAYVLERVSPALSALGPAPEHFAARYKGPVRSVWGIEGHVSFSRTLRFSKLHELDASDAAYISGLLPLGLLSGNFEETRGEVIIPDFRRPHFDIRTELLRVYD